MKTKLKQLGLRADAIAYFAKKLDCKSKKPDMQIAAIFKEKLKNSGFDCSIENYLNILKEKALCEMKIELGLREINQELADFPEYCRYFVFKNRPLFSIQNGNVEKKPVRAGILKALKKVAGTAKYCGPIAKLAFETCFSLPENRRKLNTNYGENRIAGMRTTKKTFRRGHPRYDYYADYMAVVSPDGKKIYVDYGEGGKEYSIEEWETIYGKPQ